VNLKSKKNLKIIGEWNYITSQKEIE